MGGVTDTKDSRSGKSKQATHYLTRFQTGILRRDAKASPKSKISNGGRPVDLGRLHHTLHHIAF